MPHAAGGNPEAEGDIITVDGPEAVDELERDLRTGRRRRVARIRVDLEGLDKAAATEVEDALNKHYFACGCGTATAFAFLGAIGCVVWWLSPGYNPGDVVDWRFPLWLVGSFFAGTAFGKAVGLQAAKHQLERHVRDLRRAAGPTAGRPARRSRRCAVS